MKLRWKKSAGESAAQRPGQGGRSTATTSSFAAYLLLLGQLGLIVLIAHLYQLEDAGFRNLLAMAGGSFAVHYWLPGSLRVPAFVVCSLGGLLVLLGVADAGWLFGVGMVLILCCRLPCAMVAPWGAVARLRGAADADPWWPGGWPLVKRAVAYPRVDLHVPIAGVHPSSAPREGPVRAGGPLWHTSSCCRAECSRCSP